MRLGWIEVTKLPVFVKIAVTEKNYPGAKIATPWDGLAIVLKWYVNNIVSAWKIYDL